MTTAHTASPELPDLDRLEALAHAADPHGAGHLVTHYRLSANLKAEEAWRKAANPAAVLALIALARRPPVPAQRPTDDELWDSTIRDRDTYHEWADKLADAIASYFGVDIGEHSNQNCPWHEALEAIESAEPARRAQPEGEAPQAVYPSNEIMAEICEVAGYTNLSMQQIREVFDRHVPAAQLDRGQGQRDAVAANRARRK